MLDVACRLCYADAMINKKKEPVKLAEEADPPLYHDTMTNTEKRPVYRIHPGAILLAEPAKKLRI